MHCYTTTLELNLVHETKALGLDKPSIRHARQLASKTHAKLINNGQTPRVAKLRFRELALQRSALLAADCQSTCETLRVAKAPSYNNGELASLLSDALHSPEARPQSVLHFGAHQLEQLCSLGSSKVAKLGSIARVSWRLS